MGMGRQTSKAFEASKDVLAKETMLYCPDCKKTFLMFPDASNAQLGCHISQTNDDINFTEVDEVLKATHNAVLFRTMKLNACQINYTVMDKELLSIVDSLLEHKTILCRALIYVYTDHKNLTHGNATYATARVQRHRLIVEEFGCTCTHMPGKKNVLSGILSCVKCKTSNEETYCEEFFRLKTIYEDAIQVTIKL